MKISNNQKFFLIEAMKFSNLLILELWCIDHV
jgi:hypothetical protein